MDFYCSNGVPSPPPPSLIFLLTSLLSAMMAVKNLQSTKAHLFVLCFHTVLTKFFLLFSEVSVMVVWAPFDITLIGFRLVSFIAEEQHRALLLMGLTVSNWWLSRRNGHTESPFIIGNTIFILITPSRAFNFQWHGTSPSHTYQNTIVSPPSEIHHPLWREATWTQLNVLGQKTKKPLYRRHTTSTTLQLAVDHAFMGSYTTQFHPSDPPETMQCPCSSVTWDPLHIILDCFL